MVTTGSNPPEIERLERLEGEVMRRLGRLDAGIEEVREGEFISRIIKREVKQILEEEEMERLERIREEKDSRISEIRRGRRKKLGIVCLGFLTLGGAAYGYKEYRSPEKNFSEVIKETSQSMYQNISERIQPPEVPPEEGQRKVWVSPSEEQLILTRRLGREELKKLVAELNEARLQLEGWLEEPETNPLRESAIEHWERQTDSLSNKIREKRSLLGEQHLRAAPSDTRLTSRES